jgi:glycosyltransferase involved in cell wall biosynthesis
MRIGLNLLYLIPGRVGGTERYAISLLRAMARLDTVASFYVFVSSDAAEVDLPTQPNFHRVVCRFPAQYRSLRYLWEQVLLPFQLRRRGIDLVHSLGYVGPLRSSCRRVVTICDTNYLVLRDLLGAAKRQLVPFFVRESARRSDHVLTLSNFAATQIQADTGIEPSKITVTYLGGREEEAGPAELKWVEVAERYAIRKPYVVAFSSPFAHKNIPRLIDAFSRLPAVLPHWLVLIGHVADRGSLERAVRKAGLGERVVLAGYVPEAHVAPLLQNADLLVFPTLYEGFGLPLLEAQELGVPVACSRTASLPEIAGDSALFFDPTSVEEMTEAISRSLTDPGLRIELARKGSTNVRRFTWVETARKTLAVYHRVLGELGPAPVSREE